jgi:hypothetical protein
MDGEQIPLQQWSGFFSIPWSGIRDPARTPVRCHNYRAGHWAAICIQEPIVPDPCGDLFNQRPHHERAADHPQRNAAFRHRKRARVHAFILILLMMRASDTSQGLAGTDSWYYAGRGCLSRNS